jgi:NADH dehydrogenase
LILGGGFAGLHAALELERALGSNEVSITIVNRDNFSLFTPMLHEVAASDLDMTHIVNPIRKLLRRSVFFAGEVESVDLAARAVVVSHSEGGHRHALRYDHLVLALGSVTNFYGTPGLEGRALTMKTLGDAIALRNRLIQLLEEGDFECAAEARHELLTVVVAGGGFAGVETIAGVNDFLREALPFYPHLAERDLRVVLVHPGSVILPELSPTLGRYAERQLARRGVEIHLNTSVTGVTAGGVSLSDGTVIPAQTIVWTAGTAPNPIVAAVPCAKERGRVRATAELQVPGWPGVWAVGDCAAVPNEMTGMPHPPTAQHALRQGRRLARNIVATIRGRPLKPFVFSTLGQLAAIGRRAGVANILGLNFSGFIAWWLWRTIYLLKLPRFDRKVRVALDWSLDLFFSKDLVQFHTARARSVSEPEADTVLPAPPPRTVLPDAEPIGGGRH